MKRNKLNAGHRCESRLASKHMVLSRWLRKRRQPLHKVIDYRLQDWREGDRLAVFPSTRRQGQGQECQCQPTELRECSFCRLKHVQPALTSKRARIHRLRNSWSCLLVPGSSNANQQIVLILACLCSCAKNRHLQTPHVHRESRSFR